MPTHCVRAACIAACLTVAGLGSSPLLAGADGDTPRTTVSRELDVLGASRGYLLDAPPRKGQTVPTVIVLHGDGGTPFQISQYFGFGPVAAREGFAVAYPEAKSRMWNDVRFVDQAKSLTTRGAEDVAFLNLLVDDLVKAGIADPRRIYLTGLSNGGFMAMTMACLSPKRFAAFCASGRYRAGAGAYDVQAGATHSLVGDEWNAGSPRGLGQRTRGADRVSGRGRLFCILVRFERLQGVSNHGARRCRHYRQFHRDAGGRYVMPAGRGYGPLSRRRRRALATDTRAASVRIVSGYAQPRYRGGGSDLGVFQKGCQLIRMCSSPFKGFKVGLRRIRLGICRAPINIRPPAKVSPPKFIHLKVHSAYSLLEGALPIGKLASSPSRLWLRRSA